MEMVFIYVSCLDAYIYLPKYYTDAVDWFNSLTLLD